MSHTSQTICKTSPRFSRSVGGNTALSTIRKKRLVCGALLSAHLFLLSHQPPTLLPTAWWDSRSPTSPHWWLSSRSSRSSCSNGKVNSNSTVQKCGVIISQRDIPVVLHVLALLPQITRTLHHRLSFCKQCSCALRGDCILFFCHYLMVFIAFVWYENENNLKLYWTTLFITLMIVCICQN